MKKRDARLFLIVAPLISELVEPLLSVEEESSKHLQKNLAALHIHAVICISLNMRVSSHTRL